MKEVFFCVQGVGKIISEDEDVEVTPHTFRWQMMGDVEGSGFRLFRKVCVVQ